MRGAFGSVSFFSPRVVPAANECPIDLSSLIAICIPADALHCQSLLRAVAALPSLERVALAGVELARPSAQPGGALAAADLSPLTALTALTMLQLSGGSAAVSRASTFGAMFAPLAAAGALPRLAAVELCLEARRWRFSRPARLSADEFRAWACSHTGGGEAAAAAGGQLRVDDDGGSGSSGGAGGGRGVGSSRSGGGSTTAVALPVFPIEAV